MNEDNRESKALLLAVDSLRSQRDLYVNRYRVRNAEVKTLEARCKELEDLMRSCARDAIELFLEHYDPAMENHEEAITNVEREFADAIDAVRVRS